jgi:hypothetical protein
VATRRTCIVEFKNMTRGTTKKGVTKRRDGHDMTVADGDIVRPRGGSMRGDVTTQFVMCDNVPESITQLLGFGANNKKLCAT